MQLLRAMIVGVCALAAASWCIAQQGPDTGLGRETLVRDDPRTPRVRLEVGWNGGFVAHRWNHLRVLITGGERPVGGLVDVEHTGYGSGAVRITHPYAVAPGATTPIDVMIPAGGSIERLVVTVTDERGVALRRVAIVDWLQNALTTPPTWHREALVGASGSTTVTLAASQWALLPHEPGETAPSPRAIEIVQQPARELPVEPMAYDALEACIVAGPALDEAPEAAVRALRTWTEQGGRLVIVASAAGDGWKRWVSPGLLELGELRAGAAGATRAITLSDRAARDGWRLREPDEVVAAPLADGPVGLGWVVVLAGEPAGPGASAEQAAASWGAALVPLLEDRLLALAGSDNDYWWEARSSGMDSALDAVAADLGASSGVQVWPVLAGLGLLALCLGPIDWFVLKRARKRHRSWLTALGWIGVASGLAYAMPLATMSTGTTVRAIAVEDGAVGMPFAARSAALGVLPGSGGASSVDGQNASWWRPVSAGWSEPRFQGSTMLAQTPSDEVGASLRSMTLRVRSMRLLHEEGAAPPMEGVVVRRVGDGYEVRVEGEAPALGALRAPEGWWSLAQGDDGVLRTVGAPSADPPAAWAPRVDPQSRWEWQESPQWVEPDSPGAALVFDAARRRWGLLERRAQRGGWVVALLAYDDAPARAALAGAPEAQERRVVRVAAPIEDAEGSQ